MSTYEISTITSIELPDERLHGFGLEAPSVRTAGNTYALPIEGWIVPKGEAIDRLRLVVPATGFQVALPVTFERPDVAANMPDIPWAIRSGFRRDQSLAPIGRHFEIHIVADLPGQSEEVWLGTIHGERRSLPMRDDVRLNPIMITTLGRTGGT